MKIISKNLLPLKKKVRKRLKKVAKSHWKVRRSLLKKTFESNVEIRVRFRNEMKTARFLLNNQFDRGEDVMRKYIDDFNFKLIESTFDVLAKGESKEEGKKTDYEKYKIHLNDNYSRLVKGSIINELLDTVKVIDYVKEEKKDVETEDKIETEKKPDTSEKKSENKTENK